jgi:chromosomal replication initiator protein
MSEIGGKTASSVVTNLQLKDTALEPTPEIMTTWKRVHNGMRTEFGEAIFRSWLKPLTLQAYYHGTMEISVPTRFMRDWIQTHYAERILEMCGTADAEIKRIQFVVSQAAGPDSVFDSSSEQAVINTVKANENRKNQIAEIASPLDARFKFDTFVVGKSNALAHAAARRVVESMSVPFNPLFIYGGVGLGKTHLMHAIAHALEQHWPDKVVMYLSAEKFMYQFVKALRANDTMNFKDQFRSVDVLMIDDIQFITPARNRRRKNSSIRSTRWLTRTSRSLSRQTKRRQTSRESTSVFVRASHGVSWPISSRPPMNCDSESSRASARNFRPMCRTACWNSLL